MDKITRLMSNEIYRQYMDSIRKNERQRRFCLHGIDHSLDVARIAYIINLEEGLGFDKECIYAMALLHDIGRAKEYEKGVSHHKAGADIAKTLLMESGFDEELTAGICRAIGSHKHDSGDEPLGRLLYKADKLSRCCFNCAASDDCYWDDSQKNKNIIY